MDFIKGAIKKVEGKLPGKSRGQNTQLQRDAPKEDFQDRAAKTVPGTVRMFSGCMDEQTSADVSDVTSFGLPKVSAVESAGGACTNGMLSTLAQKQDLTFAALLIEMQKVLKKRGYTQIPQLSSSNQVNLKEEAFTFKNPKPSGKTKALLIGINYFGQQGELSGCVNDVKMIKKHIVEKQGFATSKDRMRILTDDPQFTDGMPTGDNILDAMEWLLEGAAAGDSLFFHYSGHGGQMPDQDGDEEDGFDETLIPSDYKTEGQIRDDTIYEMMVAPLPKGVHLLCIFDCCHSGTILDLPFIFSGTESGIAALMSGEVSFLGSNPFFKFDKAIQAAKSVLTGGVSAVKSAARNLPGFGGKAKTKK